MLLLCGRRCCGSARFWRIKSRMCPRHQPICAVLRRSPNGAKIVLARAHRHGQYRGCTFSFGAYSGESMSENQLYPQTMLATENVALPDGVQLRRFAQSDLEAAQTLSQGFQWPHRLEDWRF